jgi:hypothetical protein
MGTRACAVTVLMAAAAVWLLAGTQREHPVVAAHPDGLRSLEVSAAARPDDPQATGALVQYYLEAHQPGLAVALVEGAAPATRDDPRLLHVYARALIDEGRNARALDAERQVLAACRPVIEGASPAPDGCDAVLLASATRRADILNELLSLGVEDAPAHPEMSLVAYQNATREAHVMVQ